MRVKKETLFAFTLLVGILLISGVFVIAGNGVPTTLDEYLANADFYSGGLTDQQILELINNALSEMSFEEQEMFSGFNDGQIIAIARGTNEGLALVNSFSEEQADAANEIFGSVMSELNGETAFSVDSPPVVGIWGSGPGTCPKPPKGICSGNRCIQRASNACQYVCGSNGRFGPGTFCTSGVCNSQGTGCGVPLAGVWSDTDEVPMTSSG